MSGQLETSHNFPRCLGIRGTIVGLEKISEQYITGHGSVQGSHQIHGTYTGSHNPYVLPGQNIGSISGSGSITGSSSIQTDYEYLTRFFIRDDSGVDTPFEIDGEHLPLLNGHMATAIFVFNDRNQALLIGIVNHITRIEHSLASIRKITRHLRIPAYRNVRQEILTREIRQRRLRSHIRATQPKIPWLWLSLAIGLVAVGIGLLIRARFGMGASVLIVLGVGTAAVSGGWLCQIAYTTQKIQSMPLYKTVRIENEKLSAELRRIEALVQSTLRSG